MKNIAFNLIATGEIDPRRPAVVSQRGEITYGRLNQILWNFANQLRSHGVNRQSCVALMAPNSLVGLVGILSTAMLGARWVQATPAMRENRNLGVTHFAYTGEGPKKPMPEGIVRVPIRPEWLAPAATGIPLQPQDIDAIQGNENDSDIWMLAQSSGTTGKPKFMALSYENYWLRNNKAPLTHDFEPVITGCLFPALSGPWVSYNLRTLKLKGTLVFGQSLDFLARKNVQKIFGSPTQFDAFLKLNQYSYAPKLPIAHVAGATISRGFAERILSRFDLIHNFYGGTEIGGISRHLISTPQDDTRCVGKILDGNELRIIDAKGKDVATGEQGLIGIRNNIIAPGYLGEEEATKQCFKAGWFFSGDVGYQDAEGKLYVVGRLGDVLNISGVKVNAKAPEHAVNASPLIKESVCFVSSNPSGSDELAMAIEPGAGGGTEEILGVVRTALKNLGQQPVKVRKVYFVESLPRNQNGKVVRGEIAGMVQKARAFDLAY